jgi:aspartate/methionine/tyrosine aminotransferase
MKPTISKKAKTFNNSKSPVREIMDYANPAYFKEIGLDPADVISFVGGWVNHETPKEMQQSYVNIIQDDKRFHISGGYSPTLGFAECRQAIVDYEKHLFNIEGLNPSQIAIGANSTQLTTNLMQLLLDDGDKILLLDPSYCNYPAQIKSVVDVEILRFPVIDVDSWTYVADEKIDEFTQQILQNKPKIILLISPDNPSSQIPSDKFVQAALNAAKETGSYLVIDFAYKGILFNKAHPDHYSWAPNENFISLHSNSKWCRGLGRRLGWIEAPESIVELYESAQAASILCPDSLHQMAFTEYVNMAIKNNSLKPYLYDMNESYKKAAEVSCSSIDSHLGLPRLQPQGGLYNCIKIDQDGSRFVEKVLKETAVLFVPGWGFGETLKNAIRISYGPLAYDLEKIEIAMLKVGKFLQGQLNLRR